MPKMSVFYFYNICAYANSKLTHSQDDKKPETKAELTLPEKAFLTSMKAKASVPFVL